MRAAIEQGNKDEGDFIIHFSSGVFGTGLTEIPILHASLPPLVANFTITGPTGATVSLVPIYSMGGPPLFAMEEYRIMEIDAASTTTIENLTFADARLVTGAGGAILNKGTLTIDNCTFDNNYAQGGGGAIANDLVLTITNSWLTNNKATIGSDGGAIRCGANGNCVTTVEGTVIQDNLANKGGGIAVLAAAQLYVTGSQISYNSATGGEGGGLYSSGATVEITGDTTFEGNSADYGGGVYNSGGTTTLSYVTFESNIANYWGGAIWAKIYSTTNISYCTFSGNMAQVEDGGDNIAYTGVLDSNTFINIVGCTGLSEDDPVHDDT